MSASLRALLRAPSPLMAQDCALTHMDRRPIDMARAVAQHGAYADMLRGLGLKVTVLPPLAGHPDCAFVEDCLFVLPEVLVVCRPGTASRRGEVASVLAAMPRGRPRIAIEAPATLEGGDLLRIGRTIYAGLSSRSNAAGIAALAQAVTPHGYSVVSVPLSGALHLKTACIALSPDHVLFNPEWVDGALFTGMAQVAVDPGEPFAANVLTVGDVRVMVAAYPATLARVAALGFDTRAINVSEFAKAEAGLTCLSVLY